MMLEWSRFMSDVRRASMLEWIQHVRESVRSGVSLEALQAKLRVTEFYIQQLKTR